MTKPKVYPKQKSKTPKAKKSKPEKVGSKMDQRFITKEPTPGGSVYVKPQDVDWKPSQFEGIQIKVLYERPEVGELTCLLKWEPGARLPFHQHPELSKVSCWRVRSTITMAFAVPVNSSGVSPALSTRRGATRAPFFWRSTASPTFSATRPDSASRLPQRRNPSQQSDRVEAPNAKARLARRSSARDLVETRW